MGNYLGKCNCNIFQGDAESEMQVVTHIEIYFQNENRAYPSVEATGQRKTATEKSNSKQFDVNFFNSNLAGKISKKSKSKKGNKDSSCLERTSNSESYSILENNSKGNK